MNVEVSNMLAICSDQAAYTLKRRIKAYLDEAGVAYVDMGNYDMEVTYFSYFVDKTCRFMLAGHCKRAIILCGSGIGIGLAANKYPGIRCGRCDDPTQVALARRENDMNVLAMGARVTGAELAVEMVKAFLETPFDPLYQRSLDSLHEADRQHFKDEYL
ncbi:MAG: RpiB/LacA/LacB family sugar-phosphate isomerase [Christensenellales bacterium]|jgi:ribose 5-phosphate isomerase B